MMRLKSIRLDQMEICMCGKREVNPFLIKLTTPTVKHGGGNNLMVWGCMGVKILTLSLVRSGVMDLLFIISLLYLVSSSIIPLTIHYQPLSIPFWSICSLVLLIKIITLGSSSINYDFILTSYYPSNGCFTQKLGIPDYYIVISYFIILYMFHFYLGI